jgi:hypothetical protein
MFLFLVWSLIQPVQANECPSIYTVGLIKRFAALEIHPENRKTCDLTVVLGPDIKSPIASTIHFMHRGQHIQSIPVLLGETASPHIAAPTKSWDTAILRSNYN